MFFNLKYIKKGFKRSSGRNNQGKITIRHRGGGSKRKVFLVDFYRSIKGTFIVCGFFQKRSGSASLALLKDIKKTSYHFIINPQGLQSGDLITNYAYKKKLTFNVGSSYHLSSIPVGSHVHNVEIQPEFGGKIIRSPGCFGVVLQKNIFSTLVKLPSGQLIIIPSSSRASYGEVNNYKKFYSLSKAGQARWLGKRPAVRGVAINAKDHPHGGGEGKSRLGRFPVSPWGSLLKGKKKL